MSTQRHPADNFNSAEDYIVNRYRCWSKLDVAYPYGERKASRLYNILNQYNAIHSEVLEIGVGAGKIAIPLCKRSINIIGVDLSMEGLQRSKAASADSSLQLVQGSAFDLPFSDGAFPLVYAIQVLHLFGDDLRLELFREVSRVLRSDGIFVFDILNKYSHSIKASRMTQARRRRRFPSVRRIRDLSKIANFKVDAVLPGVLPLVKWPSCPNNPITRFLSHTTFYVTRKASRWPSNE